MDNPHDRHGSGAEYPRLDGGCRLIVTEEDSGQAYYTHHYTHFEWPEGASGPTAGIGSSNRTERE